MRVHWLNLYPETVTSPGMWDQTIVSWLVEGYPVIDSIPHEGGVVVIPGRYHAGDTGRIKEMIAPMRWVLVVVTSDEEGSFDTRDLRHPRMKIWAQTPGPGFGGQLLPLGWTPHAHRLPPDPPEKDLDWFFAGQITHERRRQCVEALRKLPNGLLIETEGFTQGLPPDEYMVQMMRAKVVPCPSGPVHVETFRTYEALQAGAIPIIDPFTPNEYSDYWERFPDAPLLTTDQTWAIPEGWLGSHVVWPGLAIRNSYWWLRFKTDLKRRFADDIADLSGEPMPTPPVTVLIPTSPIPSHPSTEMIETVIASVKEQLLDAPIVLMIDGIRPEQEALRPAYEEYTRRILWRCLHQWDALPLLFTEHTHQAGMARRALAEVRSPLVLYVEADTPLRGEIPWDQMIPLLRNDDLDVIRLNHDWRIHPEHQTLMVDLSPINLGGLPLVRTRQWSQRPHLARTDFYRNALSKWFAPDARCFIEDRMYWVTLETGSWTDYRIALYAPGGDQSRSYHLDGRQGADKYSGAQTW